MSTSEIYETSWTDFSEKVSIEEPNLKTDVCWRVTGGYCLLSPGEGMTWVSKEAEQ